MEHLTSREFWLRYWEDKPWAFRRIGPQEVFADVFTQIVQSANVGSAIEIGGFPGQFAIYLHKYHGVRVALLDYVIHPQLMQLQLQLNELPPDAITIFEQDLFAYQPTVQYDLVFSCGLIEHFDDTVGIIRQHLPYLRPGGTLLLTLPNFRGFNGWLQRRFHPENFDKHYLQSMDPTYLRSVIEQMGLVNVQAQYYGVFGMWLENIAEKSSWFRLAFRATHLMGRLLRRLLPFQSRLFSPYIVVWGRLPAA